jgi:hypothetical protein
MGLKGYRLWDMGQLDSTCRAPPHAHCGQGVAVQVDPFESKGLKPGYHFVGSRVETGCLHGGGFRGGERERRERERERRGEATDLNLSTAPPRCSAAGCI